MEQYANSSSEAIASTSSSTSESNEASTSTSVDKPQEDSTLEPERPIASTSTSMASNDVASTSSTGANKPKGPTAHNINKKSTIVPGEGEPPLPRHLIREGDNVLLRLPSTIIKAVKLTNPRASISLGKYGSFKTSELIGKPYGPTYEILEHGKIKVVQHRTLNEIEETEANNQEIAAFGAQKLTNEDIALLKTEGLSGREIIQKQIEEHSSFEKKTEYSKEKYMKRKEAKYLQLFTPIEPTVHNICQYNFEKLSAKIRELRPDSLSVVLNSANVRPGSRLLVVDDVHGMVVAGCVERMGGQGRIMVINSVDSPPDLHILEFFNFPASHLEPINSLHWGQTEPQWVAADLPLEPTAATLAKQKNSRDLAKLRKRKQSYELVERIRQDFFRGEFDGVILATEFEPTGVLMRLLPYIAGSAPIVVYSPTLPILFESYLSLRSHPCFLAPNLSEPWLRRYQVLPGRTHPEMQGMGSGGYVLTTIRVYENEEANSHKSKRRKKEGTSTKKEAAVAVASTVGTIEEGPENGVETKQDKDEVAKVDGQRGSETEVAIPEPRSINPVPAEEVGDLSMTTDT